MDVESVIKMNKVLDKECLRIFSLNNIITFTLTHGSA